MTKREMFETLLTFGEVKANEDCVKGINHELELLSRKNSSPKKPTATQIANEKIRARVLAILDSPMTVTEIGDKIQPDFPDVRMTTSKVSYIMSSLGTERGTGQVVKAKGKDNKMRFERA